MWYAVHHLEVMSTWPTQPLHKMVIGSFVLSRQQRFGPRGPRVCDAQGRPQKKLRSTPHVWPTHSTPSTWEGRGPKRYGRESPSDTGYHVATPRIGVTRIATRLSSPRPPAAASRVSWRRIFIPDAQGTKPASPAGVREYVGTRAFE